MRTVAIPDRRATSRDSPNSRCDGSSRSISADRPELTSTRFSCGTASIGIRTLSVEKPFTDDVELRRRSRQRPPIIPECSRRSKRRRPQRTRLHPSGTRSHPRATTRDRNAEGELRRKRRQRPVLTFVGLSSHGILRRRLLIGDDARGAVVTVVLFATRGAPTSAFTSPDAASHARGSRVGHSRHRPRVAMRGLDGE